MTTMPPKALHQWRPLTIGDVAFLLDTDPLRPVEPGYVKKWIKKGSVYGRPFVAPRWVSTSAQRFWAYADLVDWTRRMGWEIRPLADLDAAAEAVRAEYGWEVVT
jgi:hypothetical protein